MNIEDNVETPSVKSSASPSRQEEPTFEELITAGIEDADKAIKEDPKNSKFLKIILVLFILTVLALAGNFIYKTLQPTPQMILSSCWEVSETTIYKTSCIPGEYTHTVESIKHKESECSQESNYAILDALPGNVLCLKPVA